MCVAAAIRYALSITNKLLFALAIYWREITIARCEFDFEFSAHGVIQ